MANPVVLGRLVTKLERILPKDAFDIILSKQIRQIIAATTIQRWYRKRLAQTYVCDFIDFDYTFCGRRFYLTEDDDYLFCGNRCYFHRCQWNVRMHKGIRVWCLECKYHHCGECGQRCVCDTVWDAPCMTRRCSLLKDYRPSSYDDHW